MARSSARGQSLGERLYGKFQRKVRDELLNGKIFDTLWEAKQAEVFRQIVLKPLEDLSRNIVIRLLYTDA